MLRFLMILMLMPLPLWAAPAFTFSNIDGGEHQMQDWTGKPVLVVNTASLCGFTPQYAELQDLHETYGDQGLVVLAVPSNDFAQELAGADEVKEFCEINFALTLPMTDITAVKGRDAHAFYQWVRQETGFAPRWNFNKVLIAPDGSVAATWGSNVRPMSRSIMRQIIPMLGQS